MKVKNLIITLLAVSVLTGCTASPNTQDSGAHQQPSDPTVEERIETDPMDGVTEETGAVENNPTEAPPKTPTESPTSGPTSPAIPPAPPAPTEQPATEVPTEPPVTEPKPTKPKPTEPKPTAPPATEPKPTDPPVIEPKPTQPPATEPPVTEPPETDPPAEKLDLATLEAYGRSYASSTYGYKGSPGTGFSSNAGYYPPSRLKITSMEEGKRCVRELVDSQYRYDVASGNPITAEIDGVTVRMKINIYIAKTDDPDVYLLYCFYGGK